jgi:hypothetical protein
MTIKQIAGSWRLKSFKIESPEGNIRDWGNQTHGLLIYSPDGFMSVSVNKEVPTDSKSEFEWKHRFGTGRKSPVYREQRV